MAAAHPGDVDGLVEPSMPTLPSVVNQMKDINAPTGRKSSMDPTDQVMTGIIGAKPKMYSFASPNAGSRKTKAGGDPGAGSASAALEEAVKKSSAASRIRLTAKQQKDIADAFNAFDVRGIGYMSTVDLRVALRALGFEARKEEMIKILEKWDRGYTGRLCYADFMNIIQMKLGEDDTKEDILKAFKLFDKDNVGHISFHNLRHVADELDEDCNDEEIAEMLAEADLNDDGTIDEDEFNKISTYTEFIQKM